MNLRDWTAKWLARDIIEAQKGLIEQQRTVMDQYADKTAVLERSLGIEIHRLTIARQDFDRAERHLAIAEGALAHKDERIEALNIALGEIIMCRTPGANATVKRMAQIAYDTLYPDGVPT